MKPAIAMLMLFPLMAQDAHRVEKEKVLAARLAADYLRSVDVIDSPEVLARVADLARTLVPPESEYAYRFELVDDRCSEWKEPAALPGGYVLVRVSLIYAVR